jgi:hypothetical protein
LRAVQNGGAGRPKLVALGWVKVSVRQGSGVAVAV